MSMESELVKLVQATVRQELDNQAKAMKSRGGDEVITSMHDIHLRSGPDGKIFANGTEIGTSTGSAGNADTVDLLHASAFLRKDAGAGDQTENNKILMASESPIEFYNSNGNLDGWIYADYDAETVRNFFIKASETTLIDLKPAVGSVLIQAASSILLSATTYIDALSSRIANVGTPTSVTDAARYKDGFVVCTSGTRPASPTEGMHIYETDTDKDYKCTVGGGTPTWVELASGAGSGDVVANATRTLNTLTKWTDATNKIIGNSLLSDNGTTITAAGALAMGTNKITGLGAGTTNGDAIRYEQLVGAYLPLSAGSGQVLTGDIYMSNASHTISIRNNAGDGEIYLETGHVLKIVVA